MKRTKSPIGALAVVLCSSLTIVAPASVRAEDAGPTSPGVLTWLAEGAAPGTEAPGALDAVPNSGAELLRKAQVGVASYYGREFQGRKTASGHVFDPEGMTAAHRQLPLGTRVRITNLANGRSHDATINDRGPFVHGRIIDVSRGLAERLGFIRAGIARVKIEVLGWQPVRSLRAAVDPDDTPHRRSRPTGVRTESAGLRVPHAGNGTDHTP